MIKNIYHTEYEWRKKHMWNFVQSTIEKKHMGGASY